MADIHYPQTTSHPNTIHYSTNNIKHNITHNLTLLNHNIHLLSIINNNFYNKILLKKTHHTNINISNYIHLHNQNTSTYLTITNQNNQTILTINNTHLLKQLTPQLLNKSHNLLHHTNIILTNYNLTTKTLK